MLCKVEEEKTNKPVTHKRAPMIFSHLLHKVETIRTEGKQILRLETNKCHLITKLHYFFMLFGLQSNEERN